jgi:ATP-dependent RNA helicase SUPV3L1/SUV3
MIEVWRLGRATRPEGRRHRPRRRAAHEDAGKSMPRTQETVAAGPAEQNTPSPSPEPAAAAAAPAPEARHSRHRRRHAGEHRSERPPRDRERPVVKRFERREKAPDPNSPFAKLAALKAQLEADAKERNKERN